MMRPRPLPVRMFRGVHRPLQPCCWTMSEQKKLTTAEILALARKKDSGAEAPASTSPVEAPPSGGDQPAAAPPAAESAPATPKSTADILAAARAQVGGAAKPAGGSQPKSTADILAAARAQKAGGAPSPAAAKPSAAAKPAVKPAGGGVAVAERPPLRDMVAAVKSVQEGKVPAKLPSRGAAPPRLPRKEPPVTRRSFFGMLTSVTVTPFALAWGAMTAIGTLWLLATARFMMPNMVLELPSRFKIGPPSDYPPGTVSEKYKASRGIWVVNTDQYDGRGMIYTLLSICTHLGCTPNWLESEQKFKCPCHGSGFYITGINFEGPAPRPLERVGLRIAEDGMLEVDKSVTFQEELGQWSDPSSYVEVA